MSTSSIHPHRNLYLLEIEEAFEELQTLEKDGFYNVPKITWWVLKYEDLYEYAYAHRHVGSCIDGMGCGCCEDVLESRFSWLYSGLEEVADLYTYEKFFEKENAIFEKIKEDYPALMQWLKKNEKLGTEEFLTFWLEWLDEKNQLVSPCIIGIRDREFRFQSEEWANTIRFCELFNELYWTSDACCKK